MFKFIDLNSIEFEQAYRMLSNITITQLSSGPGILAGEKMILHEIRFQDAKGQVCQCVSPILKEVVKAAIIQYELTEPQFKA